MFVFKFKKYSAKIDYRGLSKRKMATPVAFVFYSFSSKEFKDLQDLRNIIYNITGGHYYTEVEKDETNFVFNKTWLFKIEHSCIKKHKNKFEILIEDNETGPKFIKKEVSYDELMSIESLPALKMKDLDFEKNFEFESGDAQIYCNRDDLNISKTEFIESTKPNDWVFAIYYLNE
jgi:hypothetical protein